MDETSIDRVKDHQLTEPQSFELLGSTKDGLGVSIRPENPSVRLVSIRVGAKDSTGMVPNWIIPDTCPHERQGGLLEAGLRPRPGLFVEVDVGCVVPQEGKETCRDQQNCMRLFHQLPHAISRASPVAQEGRANRS